MGKAQKLAERVNALRRDSTGGFAEAKEQIGSLPVRECQLLVNATPVGMNGQKNPIVDQNQLHEGQTIYDLVYEPRETALIRAGRERGAHVVMGDEMLAGQGAAAFELWTGVKGMLPVMQQALDEYFRGRR